LRFDVLNVHVGRRRRGDLGDLAISIPGFLQPAADRAIETALTQYGDRIRQYDPFFEAQGRRLARVAFSRVSSVLVPAPDSSREPAPAGAPTWLERLYQPVIDPVMRGAEDEATILAKPLITKAIIAGVTAGLILVVLGRVTKRCR